MSTKEKSLDKTLEKKGCNGNRCPDYDEDCFENSTDGFDPTRCFMGGIRTDKDGNTFELERAKGYCPPIHTSN